MYVIFRYYDVMRLQIYGSTALVERTSALLAVLLGKDSFLRVLLSFARVPPGEVRGVGRSGAIVGNSACPLKCRCTNLCLFIKSLPSLLNVVLDNMNVTAGEDSADS